jgi:hypothetical protein
VSGAVDEDALKRALGRAYGWHGGIDIDTGPDVPGLIVFSAHESGAARARVTGVFDGELHVEFPANADLVLRALGFGTPDAAEPVVIAGAVGMLEANPGGPFVDEFVVEHSIAADRIKMPRLSERDGKPALEYWNSSAQLSPWKTVIVALGAGRFDYGREPI